MASGWVEYTKMKFVRQGILANGLGFVWGPFQGGFRRILVEFTLPERPNLAGDLPSDIPRSSHPVR